MGRKLALVLSLVVLVSMLLVALRIPKAEADGTVYIRATGAVDGTDKIQRDGETYTFTDNIFDEIMIEKDDIVVDGAGYTLQGADVSDSKGVSVFGRNNVTIKNMRIRGFWYGICVGGVFEEPSTNIVVCGNDISESTILGIELYRSSNNSVYGNNIVDNEGDGIALEGASGNSIYGNNVANNWGGIMLETALLPDVQSNHNYIYGNNITNNEDYHGIGLFGASFNVICGNYVATNWWGIALSGSNNLIYGNTISTNIDVGIYAVNSFNDSVYHNNFIDNAFQAIAYNSTWDWDAGYPSGGNYWSNYTGVDLDYDGIGEVPHEIDVGNMDCSPLVGPINFFDAGIWDKAYYSVEVVSNSSVSDFRISQAEKTIRFKVAGVTGLGFCRVTVPKVIVEDLWQGNYTVLVDGEEPLTMNNWTDSDSTYMYFAYQHSEHEVVIIPELPSAIIPPLLMVLTIIAVLLKKRRVFISDDGS
ncbi:MAG: right-handed parallel beta-helix repeat-containing protein [Candidatus Bathyarchaeota archaeon]|nr:right-handed parallel beta-helix repeat-containing protein [Candidatus Bathyarchaeota archaeon]